MIPGEAQVEGIVVVVAFGFYEYSSHTISHNNTSHSLYVCVRRNVFSVPMESHVSNRYRNNRKNTLALFQ